MKIMINLLFALLLSISITSCGSSDSASVDSNVKLPGVDGVVSTTPVDPDDGLGSMTGTSSSTGCEEATLPGCKV